MRTPIDKFYELTYEQEPREGITKDVAFNRKSFGEGQPENPDQGNIYSGLDGLRVELVQDYDDEDLRRVCSFAINATRGIDPENPPEPVDWEEMLQGGLQTALEDFRIAFAIYGMSRTGTHQLVRTRLAAFHQQSQRAHYYGDRPSVRMPESFLQHDEVVAEYQDLVERAALFYRIACAHDISYQDARFGLLEGTANFILWEGSLREFINTYAYRACSMFQWEIMHVFREMGRVLVEAHPYLEKYVKISCEKTHGSKDHIQDLSPGNPRYATEQNRTDALSHTCTYQGWEEVSPQCDFPWARESNRQFRSERHGIRKAKS